MVDPRYKQLEKGIENEMNTVGSKFALLGFGRSTDKMTKDEAAGKYGQAMIKVLSSIIKLEELIQAVRKQGGETEGLYESLSAQEQTLANQKNEQKKRVSKLGSEIASSSQNLSAKVRSTLSKSAQVPSMRTLVLKIGGPSIPDMSSPKKYDLGSSKRIKNLLPKKTIKPILP